MVYNICMFNRREAKIDAKTNLKTDYVIFVIACLLAAFLGSAYSSTLSSITLTKPTAIIDTLAGGGVETTSISTDTILTDLIVERIKNGNIKTEDLVSDPNDDYRLGGLEFGHAKGVLSSVVNELTTGKVLVYVFEAAKSVTKSSELATDIMIIVVAMIMLGVTIFIKNTYKVAFRRIFLEGHTYDYVKLSRFLFLFQVNKYIKATWTLFVTSVYQVLWDLTIVGGIIKKYSYAMVPYIVAENPDVGASEAINLSKRMMYGHKWELFKLELTFIGWHILGYLTLGISRIVFSNPYEECVKVSYYIYLREYAKENGISGAELMNDTYLFTKADYKLVEKTYADVVEIMNDDIIIENYLHTGTRGFVENNLGIIYKYDEEEDGFNTAIEQEDKISEYRHILDLEQYPGRLFPIPANQSNPRLEHIHYLRHYSIWSVISLFFIFCFIGWSWEVALHIVKDGVFVNRGTMHGPWLPIYGSGGVMILVLLYKYRKNPILEGFLAIVLCGVVEYSSHWFLEVTKGIKWWDYSGYFLNLNGRICAEGLLVFMLGGLAIVYTLAPIIDDKLRKVDKKIIKTICISLLVVFLIDMVYSQFKPNVGAGITDYGEQTVEVTEIE